MDIIQALILALLQGLTEFLPISSSGHLILPSELLGWPDQGLAFDVAVHVGTLLAVLVYFRNDVSALIKGWFASVSGHNNQHGQLAWCLILATVPAALAGLVFDDIIETHMRSTQVIASTTIVFGVLLGLADKVPGRERELLDIGWRIALIIGCAQALALIPGTSRSGITITAALFLGFSRQSAAQFSFLMSISIILLSGGYKGLQLLGTTAVDWSLIALGVAVSAISAYLCIYYFLAFINRIGMMPFVYYRLALGFTLLGIAWL